MAKPLHGMRIIDMSHVIAGPLASFYLTQMGAEVIKIEPPCGGEVYRASKGGASEGETTPAFAALNAGKRSLALDIRRPEAAALVRELARTADVFVENYRPGVVAKYGLDYAAIQQVKPDIVYCSISGYGQQGEWSKRGAYDHVVQALTGMMMMSGEGADAPPVKVGFPVIDVAVGMLGALAVVSALLRRNLEGKGQYIDASMVQASMMLMYPHATTFLTRGDEPERVGNRGYSGSPTSDTYRCTDGWLSTGANTPEQFRKLTGVLGLEALCQDGDAIDLDAFHAPGGGFVVARNLPDLQARLHEAFALTSAFAMEERLLAIGVPAARVRTLGEFLDEIEHDPSRTLSPHTYANGAARVRTPGLGFNVRDDGEPRTEGVPPLGQDNDAIFAELGLDASAIERLRCCGAIGPVS